MQTYLYPKGPSTLPANFTTPSKKYKKHILIASAALVLFMLLYFGLSTWFLYKSYKLFLNSIAGNRDGFFSFIVAVVMGFLGVFMFKALFFKSKKDKSNDIEIKKDDEPQLFEFIYKVADDAKAPRPYRVFLSNTVNACVFYDISIINLIFPTRKNLEIGIGLVNILNLGEFKSILAHEFGHFTQKSMIIGRWVYVAHIVANQIVSKRDGFDDFLRRLSNFDIRVAWVGWLLSTIVWSIRSISESFFKLVLFTQRALSREMEFHADLVAVSLTGSDALVHSLYKLQAADEAYEEAIEFVNKQLKKNKAVSDVYAIQSNSIKNMAIVLNNPAYGVSPKLEGADGSKFKMFKEQIAQAPKMWSTHPSNIDREKNAKKTYIKSDVNEQSSWVLFKDADKTKNKLTLNLYTDLKIETTPLLKQDSIEQHDKEFQRSFLLPKYRGIYLSRPLTISYKAVKNIYNMDIDSSSITSQFALLYPESLQNQLAHLKNLDDEIEMLEGLKNKLLDTNEGKINYRGRQIDRKELPDAIEKAKKEAQVERNKIIEHDKLSRNLHYAVANNIGNGWKEYLISVTTLVHYCEHTQKNIETNSRHFYDTLTVVSKIRNVSAPEMQPLIRAANELHFAIKGVFTYGKSIKLSSSVIDKLDGKQFVELLDPFNLEEATATNINSWIDAVYSWTDYTLGVLKKIREAALDELLLTEEYLEKNMTASDTIVIAPPPIGISDAYPNYDPIIKKEVEAKIDLISKFYNAEGIYPMVGRLTVACSIIIFALFFSGNIGNSKIVIYNGLPVEVIVKIDDKKIQLSPNESSEIQTDKCGKLNIETTTFNGELVESFKPVLREDSRSYIYNIANAAVLYEWFAVYGSNSGGNPDSKIFGAERWIETNADYYFEEPPQSIQLNVGEISTKEVVSIYIAHPVDAADLIKNEGERANFISQHALREKENSPYILSWLELASNLKTFTDILNKRLAANPNEVASLRMQQDFYKDKEKLKICEQQNQLYFRNQNNPDLYYLKCRCMEDNPKQDSAFIYGHTRWPKNKWLAYASGFSFIQKEEWDKALICFNIVAKEAPELQAGVASEMKRIYHLLNEDSMMVQLKDLQTPYLKYVEAIENSVENNSQDRLYAYKLLSLGKIQNALDYCTSDTSLHINILHLAAVSDGVSDDIVEKALALSSNLEIHSTTLMPAMALSAKKNLSLEMYRKPLNNIYGKGVDSILKFVALVKSNKIAEANNMLANMTAEMKGKISLVGVILLGDKAPKKWNLFASKLLYINEKPYRSNKIVALVNP